MQQKDKEADIKAKNKANDMKKKDIKPRDKNGLKHGYYEQYHANGNLWYKGLYVHGEEHGLWERYWENGQLRYKGYWIHGKYHGYWEKHWSNGKLWFKAYYYLDEELYKTSKNKLIL